VQSFGRFDEITYLVEKTPQSIIACVGLHPTPSIVTVGSPSMTIVAFGGGMWAA
jgi:hypothetical protein